MYAINVEKKQKWQHIVVESIIARTVIKKSER
jgi:hypothetical protein